MKKRLTMYLTEEDGRLIVDLDAEGFNSLEIVGALERVKHSYLYDEKAKNQNQGNNPNSF